LANGILGCRSRSQPQSAISFASRQRNIVRQNIELHSSGSKRSRSPAEILRVEPLRERFPGLRSFAAQARLPEPSGALEIAN
jgi:hypothetical protein